VAASIAFDGRFTERHPLFWPIAPAARAFAAENDWPAVESYGRAFGDPASAPVRFEAAAAPPRRRRGPVDREALYDARIVRGVVPTRPRSWHDYLNALVWATFPRAKRALHERQHRALDGRLADGARVLPPTRSREHDALALIDEGGVVLVESGGATHLVVFGHALYEGLVLGRPPPTACGLRARLPAGARATPHGDPADPAALVRAADATLWEHLREARLDPARLLRVSLLEHVSEVLASRPA
jgi:hypothetical protein